ncbi:MAG: PPC domain-containing protein [Gemmatimonadetes bacterium]|nr:PPC domain-containing protein [Gemmatimonadota bacterium]
MSATRASALPVLLVLLTLPCPLAAQIPLGFGKAVTGKLTVADQQFSDGSRYKMYAFVGNRGDTVTADLLSDDFDANLILADASGNPLTRNDDGGENCNARLTYVLPAAANYRLYANSSSRAELGEFQLRLFRGRAAAPADSTCRGFGRVSGLVQVGQSIAGRLTTDDRIFTGDSTYFQVHTLPVEPNQTVTVDLESPDFDSYLILTKGRGSDRLAENDDGGGNCNARVVYTAPDDHPLRVIVNTASQPKLQTGNFTLRVSDGESPIEAKGADCRGRPAARADRPRDSESAVRGPARPIQIGETIAGELTSRDSLYPDNTYFQLFQFTTAPAREVTIDLSSDDFDPVLIIRGGDLDESIINDDGGPGCAARVSQTFPGRGPYTILVNTTSTPERQTGRFTLTVASGSKAVQESGSSDCDRTGAGGQPTGRRGGGLTERGTPGRGAARAIAVGETATGRITADAERHSDNTPVEWWAIQGRAGETVTIDMESDDFDAFLLLRGPGATSESDDDSGGNCNPRITITFPETGTYRIGANTVRGSARGAYSLSVTRGSRGRSSARCEQSRFR